MATNSNNIEAAYFARLIAEKIRHNLFLTGKAENEHDCVP